MSPSVPLAGVIGCPIGHSRSPRIHAHWLRRHGLAGHYVPLEVRPEDLAQVLAALPKAGFVGANVTIPHKERALELADEASEAARRIGAANTLVFRDGRMHADNTDAYGFEQNIREAVPEWSAAAGPALVLGAGGAARAVIHALLAAGTPRILLANRTRARAQALQDAFGPRVEIVAWEERSAATAEAATVVNTTSLGMTGQPPLEIELACAPGAVVNDLVYAPLETALLAQARARGLAAVDGLGMLLHQAAPGFEAWFGVRPEVTPELRAEVLA